MCIVVCLYAYCIGMSYRYRNIIAIIIGNNNMR